MVEVVLEDAVCVRVVDADAASTEGGFFFDVTDVQSDMLQWFWFNFTAKPGNRMLAMRNCVSRGSSGKKLSKDT